MQGLERHKWMDNLTIVGYVVGAIEIVIGLVRKTWPIWMCIMVVSVLALRLIGYSIDRFMEYRGIDEQ